MEAVSNKHHKREAWRDSDTYRAFRALFLADDFSSSFAFHDFLLDHGSDYEAELVMKIRKLDRGVSLPVPSSPESISDITEEAVAALRGHDTLPRIALREDPYVWLVRIGGVPVEKYGYYDWAALLAICDDGIRRVSFTRRFQNIPCEARYVLVPHSDWYAVRRAMLFRDFCQFFGAASIAGSLISERPSPSCENMESTGTPIKAGLPATSTATFESD